MKTVADATEAAKMTRMTHAITNKHLETMKSESNFEFVGGIWIGLVDI